jgi:hypothetical protein
MRTLKNILLAGGLAGLAACGGAGDAPASKAAPAAGDGAEAGVEIAGACPAFEKILAARSETPAFSSLPEGFSLKPGVACRPADRQITLHTMGASTDVGFAGYECVYYDRPGTAEATGWEVWTGVLEDIAACFGGDWTIYSESQAGEPGPVRRMYVERDPEFAKVKRFERDIAPIQFEWSQEEGQKVTVFVLAP